MKTKILISSIILIVFIGGGIFVWENQQKPEEKPEGISVKEICEEAGGNLCTENEVCLVTTVDLRETDRCCPINCVTPKKATTENMVLIPASSFIMGREDREGWSPMADPKMFNDELPAHEVYVDAFYIDKYEVTNRQFKEFVDVIGYATDTERAGGSFVLVPAEQAEEPISDIGWKFVEGATWYTPEGPGSNIKDRMNHPVVHVTWNDANSYATWAGKRLPTEAEWEKAARGGTKTNWFWGDDLDSAGKYANFGSEHRIDYTYPPEVYDSYSEIAPVGALEPNGYGLYDTAGNVAEWVADWYQYDYFNASTRDNPKGPIAGAEKVIKGGFWYLCECYIRPANRQPAEIGRTEHGLGFRLALDAE